MTLALTIMPLMATSGGLDIICEAADREDLYSIALLNKTWNCIATPVLYSNRD